MKNVVSKILRDSDEAFGITVGQMIFFLCSFWLFGAFARPVWHLDRGYGTIWVKPICGYIQYIGRSICLLAHESYCQTADDMREYNDSYLEGCVSLVYDVAAPCGATKVERRLRRVSNKTGAASSSSEPSKAVMFFFSSFFFFFHKGSAAYVGFGAIVWWQKCQASAVQAKALRWQWPVRQPDLWLFAIFPCSSKYNLGQGNTNVKHFRVRKAVI